MTLFSSNIQSLNAKFDNFQVLLSNLDVNFSIIALQEVWSIGRDFCIDGYHPLISATRDEKLAVKNPNCGGGVAIYIKSSLEFERLTFPGQFVKNSYESVWVRIKFGSKSVIIGNIYRPPGYAKEKIDKALDIHFAIINQIKSDPKLKFCALYLVGDMNLDLLKSDENLNIGSYLETMFNFGMLPCITKPTRFQDPDTRISGRTPSPTLLDHIFSNSKTAKFAGILLSGLSDHLPLFLIDQIKLPRNVGGTVLKRDVSEENIKNLRSFLANFSWQPILENNDHISASDQFFKIIGEATDLAFPLKEISNNKKNNKKNNKIKLPWFSSGISKSSKKKGQLFAKMKKKPSPENIKKYKEYKNLFNSVCRAAKRRFYLDKFSLHAKNCRETWKLINTTIGRTTKKPQSFPSVFSVGGNTFDTPEKIVNGFNDFFTDVATNISKNIPKSVFPAEHYLGPPCRNKFNFIEITQTGLLKTIGRMKSKVSFGLDLVSNKTIKNYCPSHNLSTHPYF